MLPFVFGITSYALAYDFAWPYGSNAIFLEKIGNRAAFHGISCRTRLRMRATAGIVAQGQGMSFGVARKAFCPL